MGRAIGIDLGTTNSCAAIVENGKPRLITYKGGNTTIPSVFAIDDKGQRLVGDDAKKQAQLNPQNTVSASKRLIGRNFHSKTIERIKQIFTYELVEGDSSEVLIKIRDQVFTLEQISAAILRKIKEVAEEELREEVTQAVITVPAYFNDSQRQAVRTAGKLAGLKVLRILNEPTAAALAYGLGRNLDQRLAVYDLGGGTFDISIIDIKDRTFEVIATGGDTFLGGVDFDDRVMTWVMREFYRQHGIDLAIDRVAVQRVRDASESAKIALSSVSRTDVNVPYIAQGDNGMIDLRVELTREKLEELTADLVERTIANVDRILREANCPRDKVDEILLVGGQSRMPLVQRRITEFMGRPPSKGVNPDEAVGIGAAIMAHSLASAQPDGVGLLDVLPMPIGINRPDGTMKVLFKKNEKLPNYAHVVLTTSRDYQRSILLRVYQGESNNCAENEQLGVFKFEGIRKDLKGKVRIEVTFHIDSEGILSLTARDKDTSQVVESMLKLGKVAGEDAGPKKEPEAPAPQPLTMPASSLAQQLAATELGAKDAPPPFQMPASSLGVGDSPPPYKPSMGGGEETLPPAAVEPVGPAKPDVKPEPPKPEPPKPEARQEVVPAPAPAGLLGRVAAWFKGLFGG